MGIAAKANRAVFLDRDGVINRKAPEGKYITAWEEVEFLPGVGDALRDLKQSGFLLIIVTNQSAVSRDELSVDALESIHRKMLLHLAGQGAAVDAIYYCPHDRNANCQCRKPMPNMLVQAAEEHGIDLSQSWMVGDAATDIQAGRAAGCRTISLSPPGSDGMLSPAPDFKAHSLQEAARWILSFSSGQQ
ncbi:MAG TPA: HAD family hydrolase [Terriglobia bacterium]|nr:HAD family hydrolase [Terriglobia bacterium]